MNLPISSAPQAPIADDPYDWQILGSRQIGSKIASTRSADIHAISKHEVVKIHHRNVPLEDIERCARISFAVHQAGLPVPRSHARPVKVHDGRFGIIFERVQGSMLAEQMLKDPVRLPRYTRILAAQHKIVHGVSDVADLPLQSDVLAEKIGKLDSLDGNERDKVLRLLASLPGGNALCHGDFHCENVMSNAQGYTFIDWGDATLGNPLADVARTWLIMRFVTVLGWKARAYCWLFSSFYARDYLRKTSWSRKEFDAWKVVNAAARLAESVPQREIAHLRRFVKSSLARYP